MSFSITFTERLLACVPGSQVCQDGRTREHACSYGLYSYGLYSYGLYSYGLYSYGRDEVLVFGESRAMEGISVIMHLSSSMGRNNLYVVITKM